VFFDVAENGQTIDPNEFAYGVPYIDDDPKVYTGESRLFWGEQVDVGKRDHEIVWSPLVVPARVRRDDSSRATPRQVLAAMLKRASLGLQAPCLSE
jgi:hypothetical protein